MLPGTSDIASYNAFTFRMSPSGRWIVYQSQGGEYEFPRIVLYDTELLKAQCPSYPPATREEMTRIFRRPEAQDIEWEKGETRVTSQIYGAEHQFIANLADMEWTIGELPSDWAGSAEKSVSTVGARRLAKGEFKLLSGSQELGTISLEGATDIESLSLSPSGKYVALTALFPKSLAVFHFGVYRIGYIVALEPEISARSLGSVSGSLQWNSSEDTVYAISSNNTGKVGIFSWSEEDYAPILGAVHQCTTSELDTRDGGEGVSESVVNGENRRREHLGRKHSHPVLESTLLEFAGIYQIARQEALDFAHSKSIHMTTDDCVKVLLWPSQRGFNSIDFEKLESLGGKIHLQGPALTSAYIPAVNIVSVADTLKNVRLITSPRPIW